MPGVECMEYMVYPGILIELLQCKDEVADGSGDNLVKKLSRITQGGIHGK